MKLSLGRAPRCTTATAKVSLRRRANQQCERAEALGVRATRGVQGVVWHHGRRVSAVEGTRTNPLLMCTVTASDIGQHRESQISCHRGEGNEGPVLRVARMLGRSISRTHAREGQGQRMALQLPRPFLGLAAHLFSPLAELDADHASTSTPAGLRLVGGR